MKLAESFISSYQYKPPKDPERILFDFYFFVGYVYGEKFDRDDEAWAMREAVNDCVNNLQKHMIKALLFCCSAEMRHVFRTTISSKFSELSPKTQEFLKSYDMYTGAMNSSGLGKRLNPIVNPDRFSKDRMLSGETDEDHGGGREAYRTGYLLVQKVKKQHNFTDLDLSNIFFECFGIPQWPGGYGGRAWADIARTIGKLITAADLGTKIVYIDHAYDLQHNTGTVFNKLKLYYKADRRYDWIEKALNWKRDNKDIRNFYDKVSSNLKPLVAWVAYNKKGITLEDLEKEKSLKPQIPQTTSKKKPQLRASLDPFKFKFFISIDRDQLWDLETYVLKYPYSISTSKLGGVSASGVIKQLLNDHLIEANYSGFAFTFDLTEGVFHYDLLTSPKYVSKNLDTEGFRSVDFFEVEDLFKEAAKEASRNASSKYTGNSVFETCFNKAEFEEFKNICKDLFIKSNTGLALSSVKSPDNYLFIQVDLEKRVFDGYYADNQNEDPSSYFNSLQHPIGKYVPKISSGEALEWAETYKEAQISSSKEAPLPKEPVFQVTCEGSQFEQLKAACSDLDLTTVDDSQLLDDLIPPEGSEDYAYVALDLSRGHYDCVFSSEADFTPDYEISSDNGIIPEVSFQSAILRITKYKKASGNSSEPLLKVGDAVKLNIPNGETPVYGWGNMLRHKDEVGVITTIYEGGVFCVNFPSCGDFSAKASELKKHLPPEKTYQITKPPVSKGGLPDIFAVEINNNGDYVKLIYTLRKEIPYLRWSSGEEFSFPDYALPKIFPWFMVVYLDPSKPYLPSTRAETGPYPMPESLTKKVKAIYEAGALSEALQKGPSKVSSEEKNVDGMRHLELIDDFFIFYNGRQEFTRLLQALEYYYTQKGLDIKWVSGKKLTDIFTQGYDVQTAITLPYLRVKKATSNSYKVSLYMHADDDDTKAIPAKTLLSEIK